MKNNNNYRWKRTASGVSTALYLMCNTGMAQDNSGDDTFTLNLNNTDIHSLIATVSKQTGRNFVVDPRVKAKVTVISTDPVSSDGLYEVFLSVLQVHGYSAVPAGDLIKIVPDVTAKQGPVPILGNDADSSDQLVTQVVKVVNVPAAQLVPILRPMVPQQGHLAAYAATNSLIITDRSSNIQRLTTIIKRIDRPDNEEIEVVRLDHASAADIVGTLTSLQRNNIGGQQGPGAIQLVADERTNSVLISGDTAVRVRIRGLIAHLDTPIESGGNTRVVYLKFANAEDLVSILQGVSQGQAKVGASTADVSGGPTAAPQPAVVQPAANGANPAPNNLAAQRTQSQNAVRARSSADVGQSNVDIQADENTNSLIITAPADEMQNILAVIRQLDIRRAQVLVEAVIAEITEDNTREFGINFLLDGSAKDVPIGFSNLGGATDGALGIAGAASAGGIPSSLGSGLSLALGRFGTGEIDFGFLVRAIASDADNNILSTPSLLTLDNEEAEIIVGSNVPFVTGQQLSANNDNPFQTIERRDIGLTLKVRPQINDGNTIKMELEQEVSDVNATAVTGASDITTSVRSIKTTVLVEDGQTLVLGGLIDDSITDVEEKIPLLGDIPVLGRLFRYRSTQKSKQNLLIFLHPVIMRDSETASQYSSSKYNFLRSKQTLYRQKKDNSLEKDKRTLPELKLYFDGQAVDSPLTRFDGSDKPENQTDSLAAIPNPEIDIRVTPPLPPLSDIEKLTATIPQNVSSPASNASSPEIEGTATLEDVKAVVGDSTSTESAVTVTTESVAESDAMPLEQTRVASVESTEAVIASDDVNTQLPLTTEDEQLAVAETVRETTIEPQVTLVESEVLPLQTFPPTNVPAFTSKIEAPKENATLTNELVKPAPLETDKKHSLDGIRAGDGSMVILGKASNPEPKSIQSSITEDHESRLVEISAAAGGKNTIQKAIPAPLRFTQAPVSSTEILPAVETVKPVADWESSPDAHVFILSEIVVEGSASDTMPALN